PGCARARPPAPPAHHGAQQTEGLKRGQPHERLSPGDPYRANAPGQPAKTKDQATARWQRGALRLAWSHRHTALPSEPMNPQLNHIRAQEHIAELHRAAQPDRLATEAASASCPADDGLVLA